MKGYEQIKILVGLGYYGLKMSTKKCNLGFMFIDKLCDRLRIPLSYNDELHGEVAKIELKEGSLYFFKPYVENRRRIGEFTERATHHLGIQPHELMVAYDSYELELGCYCISPGGQPHKGHFALQKLLKGYGGQNTFYRLKLGGGKISPRFRPNVNELGVQTIPQKAGPIKTIVNKFQQEYIENIKGDSKDLVIADNINSEENWGSIKIKYRLPMIEL